MILLRVFGVIILYVAAKGIATKECNPSDVRVSSANQCLPTEYCDPVTRTCHCVEGSCGPQGSSNNSYSSLVENQGNGSLVAGILIPVCLILLVIFVVYISRKYELLNWMRNRFNRRDRHYDEFIIGQDDDDPPLA